MVHFLPQKPASDLNPEPREVSGSVLTETLLLQVFWTDGQQQSSGPGVSGPEGAARRPAHHQHRQNRHGVHVAPRPEASPGPGVERAARTPAVIIRLEQQEDLMFLFPRFRSAAEVSDLQNRAEKIRKKTKNFFGFLFI